MAFLTSGIAGVDLTATYASSGDTTAGAKVLPMAVGTVSHGNDGSKWILVQATSTIAQYDACIIINTSSATGASIGCVPVTTTNAATGQRFAVAQTAITSSLYGWVALEGHNL